MLMRIELPRFSGQMSRARVVQWHVGAGEPIVFGQGLVDLETEGAEFVLRDKDANSLAPRRRRNRGKVGRVETGQMNARVRLQLVASEDGYLRQIAAEPGAGVEVGDLLGYASDDTTGPDSPTGELHTVFRLVPNFIDEPRL